MNGSNLITRPSSLSPLLVQKIIQKEEIPYRAKGMARNTVQEIFKYGAIVGHVINRFDQHERCMDHARYLIHDYDKTGKSFPSGMVLLASELTKSKGRFKRRWHAPVGGLWMTLILVNTLLPVNSRLYPLAAGLSCCETLRYYNISAHLKWVNDIHVSGRKIGGVLTETVISPQHKEEYILIGVGINVNNEDFPEELTATAISMKEIYGNEFDIDQLIIRLLAKFVWNIGLLSYQEKLSFDLDECAQPSSSNQNLLLNQWRQNSDTIGRRVWFGFDVQKNPQYQAEVIAINNDGSLLLRNLADNVTIVEHSGEIVYID